MLGKHANMDPTHPKIDCGNPVNANIYVHESERIIVEIWGLPIGERWAPRRPQITQVISP